MTGDGHSAMIGEVAAEQRPDRARETEYAAEQAREPAALPRRKQIGNDGKGRGKQRAAAEALDGTEYDELHHPAAQKRQRPKLAGETR